MTESSARRALKKLGYVLRKSRQRSHIPNIDNLGDYMIVHAGRNMVVAGGKYDMTLRDIEKWLKRR
jgi:hypothetical protein